MRPDPLVPRDADLRDFPCLQVNINRLFGSAFHATANDAEWRAGVTLWLKAFHQVPAASLPADDGALTRLAELGRSTRAWRAVREVALRGWVLCSDGRLYHPVVAEMALVAWIDKLTKRRASCKANAARWASGFAPEVIDSNLEIARNFLAAINPRHASLRRAAQKIQQNQQTDDPSRNASRNARRSPSRNPPFSSPSPSMKAQTSQGSGDVDEDEPF